MTGRHAGKSGSWLLSVRWLVGIFGFLGILLAVLGILALLGWGIYLVADHDRAYTIFLMAAIALWAGKSILEWRKTRRVPWSLAGITAMVVLVLLRDLAPSWPWLSPAGYVLTGVYAVYFIRLFIRHRARNERDLTAN